MAQRFSHARAVDGVSMRHWAKQRGVSYRTVYRALRDEDDVNSETATHILEAVTRYTAAILDAG